MLGCSPMPKIISEKSYDASPEYGAVNVLSDDTCHYIVWPSGPANYWLGTTGTETSQFTIDYGCIIEITRFELRNTNNYLWDNVATDAFRIETSVDNVVFSVVVSGNLTNPFNTDECQIPLDTFEPQSDNTVLARYVKFQADTSFGVTAGLMNFRATYINERCEYQNISINNFPTCTIYIASMCMDEFQLVYVDPAASKQTPVWQIFTDDGCDEDYLNASPDNWPNYWLLPDGDTGAKGFILDYGCQIDIEGFELRNTKNSNARNRYALMYNVLCKSSH